jgi:hypothetical protein
MAKEAPSTGTVAVRGGRQPAPHLLNPAPLPPELDGLFYIQAWIKALTTNTKYVEPNPDFMAQRMMMQTLSATTVEELTSDQSLEGLQQIVPDEAWATTGNIMITDLYVAASDIEEGSPTYMLLTYITEATGVETTTSTGATHLQLQIASMLAMGIWPIRGQIKRRDRKDRGGRHLFAFYPAE